MAWLQIKLNASSADAEAVADALHACGALAVTIEGSDDEVRLQGALETAPFWGENRVTGLFPQEVEPDGVLGALRAALGRADLTPQVERLEDADWGRAWMAHYRPVRVAAGLWVTPSWCTPPDPGAVNVVLDPGLAFGTGTHATTALCLAWLAEQPLAGRRVLDYGCGSGILAIAALKLGAAAAVGVDVDPQALAVSRENAERNGVAARYRACAPDALAPATEADVLVANILSGTLIELAPALAARVARSGAIALSGILEAQARDVGAAYEPWFALALRRRDGWVLLAGPRRN